MSKFSIDEAMLPWATDLQREYVELINRLGSARAAAAQKGVNPSSVQRSIASLKASAAKHGYSPEHDMTRTVPDGFTVKGVSTYYDADGKARGQWVKSRADENRRMELIKEAVAAMAEELPRLAPLPAPASVIEDLCNLYTMTDCHMGMLAWHKEGGDDWDIAIAERVLAGCFEQMVMSSPAAKVGIVNQLGDFLHTDGLSPITPTSGHILDTDGRFSKIVNATIRVLRRIVDFALTRHETVMVVMAEGNHDIASSIWLRAMFNQLYENEPRVNVINSELPFYAYQHGQTMLTFHHGHMVKVDKLAGMIPAQFSEMWGATTKRYCHTGHYHHELVKEYPGIKIVQHPTLSARDAYAARGGWISERQATAFTYHLRHGQVGSVTIVPEMLAA